MYILFIVKLLYSAFSPITERAGQKKRRSKVNNAGGLYDWTFDGCSMMKQVDASIPLTGIDLIPLYMHIINTAIRT